jgi:hypothetical protein
LRDPRLDRRGFAKLALGSLASAAIHGANAERMFASAAAARVAS